MPLDTELAWYHTDEGVLPTAARQPWAKDGAAVVTLTDDGLEHSGAGAFRRQLFAGDGLTSPPRRGDRTEIQWRTRGISFTPTGFGISPIIVELDDGYRGLALSIGPSLTWTDVTGAPVRTVATNFPWTRWNTFHVIQDRGQAWYLYVNGELVDTLPYLATAAGVFAVPCAKWGAIGVSVARWDAVELGFNTDLPPEWKIERVRDSMPVAIKKRWNARWRALARSVLGLQQDVQNALSVAYELKTAARHAMERSDVPGDKLPNLVDPPWLVSGAGVDFSIVRERVRISTVAPASAMSLLFAAVQVDAELRIATTVTVRSSTPDGFGRVGPMLLISDGTLSVGAQLIETADGRGWTLTTGDFSMLVPLGNVVWLVDDLQPHRVELQMLGKAGSPNPRVLLLVDGSVVDDIPYSALILASVLTGVSVLRTSTTAVFDLEDTVGEVRYADLDRRPVFLQNVAERLVFNAGCERNDHLETLVRNHYGLEELRGTTTGILLELRRLSCDDDAEILTVLEEGQWYLESTYPECTPIFLEAEGQFTDAIIEFRGKSLLFTPQELADLAATYLVPCSLVELQYFIALVVDLTAPTVQTVVSSFTVSSTRGFAVGQVVTVRDAANTVQSVGTILTLDPVTGAVTTTLLDTTYIIGDIMRIVLATT